MKPMVSVDCAHDALVETEKLIPNPRNPNKHPQKQLDLLAKIIKNQGFRNPIVVSNRSGFIVKGHARLEAAKMLGLKTCPVDFQDYENEAAEWADMIADNRLAELAESSLPELKDLLEELDTGEFDMDLTGFDAESLEELMTQFHVPEEGLTEDDEIPEKVETVCKSGDLWQLGEHRLLCGDATKKEDVERLMGGEKADLCLTDPPYNISVKYHSYKDNRHDYSATMCEAFALVDSVLLPDSSVYIKQYLLNLFVFQSILPDEWQFRNLIVWQNTSQGHPKSNFEIGYEPILFLVKGEPLFNKLAEKREVHWDGYTKLDTPEKSGLMWNLWLDIPAISGGAIRSKESLSDGSFKAHPTQMPIRLAERGVIFSSQEGQICLDIYGGSGSTLIACEKLGRKCYMMEIDEHYCDVIIQRWQNFTGKEAVKLE